jgi:hypothetical protein
MRIELTPVPPIVNIHEITRKRAQGTSPIRVENGIAYVATTA